MPPDPDRALTANREIRKLRQRNGTFSAYLGEFGRLMGDLNWNEEAQRQQLYEGLSDEIKDGLVISCPWTDSMAHLIQMCKELDTRFRARAAERSGNPRTQRSSRSAGKRSIKNRSTP